MAASSAPSSRHRSGIPMRLQKGRQEKRIVHRNTVSPSAGWKVHLKAIVQNRFIPAKLSNIRTKQSKAKKKFRICCLSTERGTVYSSHWTSQEKQKVSCICMGGNGCRWCRRALDSQTHGSYDPIRLCRGLLSVGILSIQQSSRKAREHWVIAGRLIREQLFITLNGHSVLDRKHLASSWVDMHHGWCTRA